MKKRNKEMHKKPELIVVQTIAEWSLKVLVFFQCFIINNNLPSCTAGIRTGSCNTGEFFIIIWKCKLHKSKLLPFFFS